MRRLRILFGLLWLAALIQGVYYYPRLPDVVASHFDGGGRPDGWSSKGAFLGLYVGVIALLAGLFLVLSSALAWLPDSLWNLPHKDYWLAPERRTHTRAIIGTQLLWFGIATMALILWIFRLAFQVNLPAGRSFSATWIWVALGAYALFALAGLVRFIVTFSKPNHGAGPAR